MGRFVATVVSVLVGLLVSLPAFGADLSGGKVVTLIHMGDIHGHLMPQLNLRDDPTGGLQGGLARLYTKIKEIRQESPDALLINTGDTIQGSAEAHFTCGQAVVEALNLFGIYVSEPGNWDFVYGNKRFRELFGGSAPDAPPVVNCPPVTSPALWTTLAANVYKVKSGSPCGTGDRILPPYIVTSVAGLKIGILGFTTDRGPQVVGTNINQGICFTKGDTPIPLPLLDNGEVPFFVKKLRDPKPKGGEAVNAVVVISELGLSNNIRLAEKFPGIDVILSSDMHERTLEPVVVTCNKLLNPLTCKNTPWTTIITEAGDGGTMLVRLDLKVQPGDADNAGIKDWSRTVHIITSDIAEDPDIKAAVDNVRKTFVSGPDFCQPTDETCAHHVNPFNGTRLQAPIDKVVGKTTIPLHRANHSHHDPDPITHIPSMPAVIEGSSHDFLTDAFRWMAGADIGGIRGFRYGTHVGPTTSEAAGSITLADLYNFIPIGPLIAKGTIPGSAVRNQIECAADGALNPLVELWTGGWLFNFSGLTMDVNPYGLADQPLACPSVPPVLVRRAFNIMVRDWETNTWAPLDPLQSYSYASYYYRSDPCLINRVQIPQCSNGSNITVVTDENGLDLDGTEVVVRYLDSLCPLENRPCTVTPELNRIHLTAPLPLPCFGNPEIQPLRGATAPPPALCPNPPNP